MTKQKKKRGFILVGSVLLLFLLGNSLSKNRRVDIRYGATYYLGEFVLKGDPGIWEKYGLRVNHIFFSSGTENNQALISRKCDINCNSDRKQLAFLMFLEKKA